MKRVLVLAPFRLIATNTLHVPGDEIVVDDDTLARIRSMNINMVKVLGDAEMEKVPEPKKARARKPKAEG